MRLRGDRRVEAMRDQPQFQLESDPTLAVESPALADILAYWNRKRGERTMPARADIDPIELRPHLGFMMLIDVEPGPRFRFRLVGTKIVETVGRDATGRTYDEAYPAADYPRITKALRWVVENRKPVRVYGNLWHVKRDWLRFESLDLPLSRDGVNVDTVLTRTVIGG